MFSQSKICRMVLAVFMACAAWTVAPGQVTAQQTREAIPENAHVKGLGRGWECDKGFRQVDGACNAVSVPKHAFKTNVSYGRGWECMRGYLEALDACVPVNVPDNAYLNSYGDGWECGRIYQREGDSCVEIKVPKNGHLTNSSHGSGWECNRGYREVDQSCVFGQGSGQCLFR